MDRTSKFLTEPLNRERAGRTCRRSGIMSAFRGLRSSEGQSRCTGSVAHDPERTSSRTSASTHGVRREPRPAMAWRSHADIASAGLTALFFRFTTLTGGRRQGIARAGYAVQDRRLLERGAGL